MGSQSKPKVEILEETPLIDEGKEQELSELRETLRGAQARVRELEMLYRLMTDRFTEEINSHNQTRLQLMSLQEQLQNSATYHPQEGALQ